MVKSIHYCRDELVVMVDSFVKTESQHNLSEPYEQNQKCKIVFFPLVFPRAQENHGESGVISENAYIHSL